MVKYDEDMMKAKVQSMTRRVIALMRSKFRARYARPKEWHTKTMIREGTARCVRRQNQTARNEMKVKIRMRVPPAAHAGAQAQTCAGPFA